MNHVWKKKWQPVAEGKMKRRATGVAFCCSKRCDGFFNEASPSAGKWTKSAVAVAEQIGNHLFVKLTIVGYFFPSLFLSLSSISTQLCSFFSLLSIGNLLVGQKKKDSEVPSV